MATDSSERFVLLNQLADEFAARYRRGERPSIQEYVDRHPELGDAIREFFPVLAEIEQVKEDHHEVQGPPAAGPLPPLERLGDYRIIREIGRGGMGVVYEAEQQSLGRRVAVKVLPTSVSRDDKALERFRREARAAAKLHHTNIVPVFEVGQAGEVCFYAMQFIQGQPLDEVIDELQRLRQASQVRGTSALRSAGPSRMAESLLTGRFQAQALTTPATVEEAEPGVGSSSEVRSATGTAVLPGQTDLSSVEANRQPYYRSVARIGQQVANALAYAHQRGIIHRDVHQRGIIHRDVKPSNLLLDASGVVWVTDFGLARTEDSKLTEADEILGTLRYLAPERFRSQCDVRSDVYALGLTLYELLVLRPAFESADRLRLIETIYTQEPLRPRALDPHIPRDLETIVLKAIDKEPSRRYPTAEEMGLDLQRFLDDEPIKARRVSLGERLLRWWRRNPVVAGLGVAVTLLVLTLAVGSTVAAAWLGTALQQSHENQERAVQAEREAAEKSVGLWYSYLFQARAVRMSRQPGQRFDSLKTLRKAMELPLPPGRSLDELRTETVAALCLPDLEVDREWKMDLTGFNGFTIDDAFARYAVADKDGNVSIRRLADHAKLCHLPGLGPLQGDGPLRFGPNGRFLVQQCRTAAGLLARLWKLDGSEPKVVTTAPESSWDFSPDGRQCAVFDFQAHAIRVHDTETGHEQRRFPYDGPSGPLRWNPRRPLLAVAGETHWRTIDVETGKVVAEVAVSACHHLAWHPEGRLLAVTNEVSHKINVYDTQTLKMALPPLEGHRTLGIVLRFNRAGDLLVSNDWSSIWRLWDVRTGKQLLTQPAGSTCLCFSPNDSLIGADITGARVRLFRLRRGTSFRTVPPGAEWRGGGFTAGTGVTTTGTRLLAVGTWDSMALVDVERAETIGVLPLSGDSPFRMEADGVALWTCGRSGLLRWPVEPDLVKPQGYRVGPPRQVWQTTTGDAWGGGADGEVIAMPAYNKGAYLWHRQTNRVLTLGPQQDVRMCAVSPDGRWAATGSFWLSQGHGARVWDAATGQMVKELPVGGGCNVRFSPDGRWLATTSEGVRLWAVESWEAGPDLGGQGGGLAFSPDSRTLALTDQPGVVRLVETDTGRELVRLTAPEQTRLIPLCFTPDGSTLVTQGAETSALHLFDLRSIRAGLQELDLDWDAPPLPPAPATRAEPLEVRFELGKFQNRAAADRLLGEARDHLGAGDHARGLAALRQAVKTDPTHAVAYNNLAWQLLTGPKKERDPKEALTAARKAVELSPEQAMYHNTLGVAQYRNQMFKEAIVSLEKSLAGGKGQADAYDLFCLAMCHHRLGDAAKAKSCRERAGRWFEEHRGKLPADQITELTEFQAEADSVFSQPPGDQREDR